MIKIFLTNREFYRISQEKVVKKYLYNFEEFGLEYLGAKIAKEQTPDERIEYYLDVIDERLFFLSVIKFSIKYEILT
jgi:hypothetical protein